jgi:hypothetical protein
LVEAVDPFKWAFTLIPNTEKEFHNHHMMWKLICMSPCHVIVLTFAKPLEVAWTSVPFPLRAKHNSWVFYAVDPFKWAPNINIKHI